MSAPYPERRKPNWIFRNFCMAIGLVCIAAAPFQSKMGSFMVLGGLVVGAIWKN
jgi:hypothetical protein